MPSAKRMLLILSALLFLRAPAYATEVYAAATGQPCVACHISDTGGALNTAGFAFKTGGHRWPPAAGPILPLGNALHAVIGFAHVAAAFFWFGTILYVHIILRPRYAEKGIPHGEVRLGAVSMMVVGISGLLLTLARIDGWHAFTASRWGMLLGVKIALFLLMVGSAAFVVNVIGPKLKEGLRDAEHPPDGIFAPEVLAAFDGKEGRPAFISYKGKVYDVTSRQHWKEGVHFRHAAGNELTAALAKAPHGPEKLAGLTVAGTYDESRRPPKTAAQKIFYFVAYMNLSLVFVVLLVIAFWRWWA